MQYFYHQNRLNYHLALFFVAIMLLFSPVMDANAGYKSVQRGERPPIDLSNVPEDAYEQGVIRIKLEQEAFRNLPDEIISRAETGTITLGLAEVDALNAEYGVQDARQTFHSPALNNRYQERHQKWGFHLWFDLFVDEDTDIIAMVQDYKALGEVSFSEPHYKKELIGNVPNDEKDETDRRPVEGQGRDGYGWFPDDPQFDAQWHYHNTGQTGGTPGADISLPEAWTMETGNEEVIVAVVDGGINFDHPDLAGNMWEGVGYNFVSDSPDIIPHDHGAHVAGTIAAVSDNGLGVSGIAGGWEGVPGVALMSAQVFEPGFFGASGGFEIAPVYAADNGAAISQNSWGYTSAGFYEQAVLDAIDYFNVNGGGDVMEGGITIFAAGNSSNAGQNYPGYYSGTMAVAALNHNDELAWYSNYGDHIEISAPGGETNIVTEQGVLSTLNSGYGFYQGTSMACPHVSGVVALMLSMAPGIFEVDELREILLDTADPIDDNNPGYIDQLGTGRVNAYAALSETLFFLADPEAPAAPTNLVFEADPEGELSVDIRWINPDENASGETLTELDTINIYRDEELIHTMLDPVVGEEVILIDEDIDTDGFYSYVIRGANFAGEGLAISGSVYIGHDVPAKPEQIELSSAGDNAILTWEAPQSGQNDGFFDGSNLTYTVYRYPGGEQVVAEAENKVFFDTDVPGIGNYYYEVIAYNHVGEGDAGTSNVATLGADGLLIYELFELPTGELPEGWYIQGPGEGNWGVDDSDTAGGEAPQMRLKWNPSFTDVSKLITHEVNVEGYSSLEFSFRQFLRNYSSYDGDEIAVIYTTDQRESWNELMTFDENVDYGPVQEEFTIEIDEKAETIQFAFRWDGNTFNIWDWNIDDVILEGSGAFYEVIYEVEDELGEPVTGATVKMHEKSGIEVIPGVYFYNQIEPGIYSYTFEKDGYQTLEGEVEVTDEDLTENVVLLWERHQVHFDVYDQDGDELHGATITMGEESNEPGDYFFNEILDGHYEYMVEKEGYHTVTNTLAIEGDDVQEEVVLDLIVYALTFEPVNEQGDAIGTAVVTLNGTAHESGQYAFPDLTPGAYDYVIEAEMYFPAHGTVDITEDDVWKQVVLDVDDTNITELPENTVTIYPNPAKNRLTVESAFDIGHISISDIHGQEVKSLDAGADHVVMEVGRLESGIYFVRIYTNEGHLQTKRIQIIN